MRRQTWYYLLGGTTLGVAATAATLAVAAAVLHEALSVAAGLLCSAVFLVPGLFLLAYARRFRARELALAHTASFASARRVLEVPELAAELKVSNAVAEKVLQTAVREGHIRGTFDPEGRFVVTSNHEAAETP